MSIQETRHLLNGIYPALVDVVPAVASLSAADHQSDRLVSAFQCATENSEPYVGVESSRTADEKLTFVLRVKIHKSLALEKAGFQSHCTIHTGLFTCGKKAFQGTCRCIVFQQGETCGNSDSIIGSKRGVWSYHPSVTYLVAYGIASKIVLDTRIFLTDHIKMGLQHEHRYVFLTRSGLTPYEQVAGSILSVFKRMRLRPLGQPRANAIFVPGFSRDAGYLFKNFQYNGRIHFKSVLVNYLTVQSRNGR